MDTRGLEIVLSLLLRFRICSWNSLARFELRCVLWWWGWKKPPSGDGWTTGATYWIRSDEAVTWSLLSERWKGDSWFLDKNLHGTWSDSLHSGDSWVLFPSVECDLLFSSWEWCLSKLRKKESCWGGLWRSLVPHPICRLLKNTADSLQISASIPPFRTKAAPDDFLKAL